MSVIDSLHGINKYLNERPQLVDIGKSPKFIKNAISVATGTDPNKKI